MHKRNVENIHENSHLVMAPKVYLPFIPFPVMAPWHFIWKLQNSFPFLVLEFLVRLLGLTVPSYLLPAAASLYFRLSLATSPR